MTAIETEIMKGAWEAFWDYYRMSGKQTLWHGPEAFFQFTILRRVSRRKDIIVFPECSPERLKRSFTPPPMVGKKPVVRNGQRFDMAIWWRNNTPRAILETKKATGVAGPMKDLRKLHAYRKAAVRLGLSAGYLLIYTEAVHSQTIETRYNNYLANFLIVTDKVAQVVGEVLPHPIANASGTSRHCAFLLYRIRF